MKRTALTRRTPLGASKRPAKAPSRTKTYIPPAWFMAVKPGAHGNSPAQKRLWRIVSEYVRQRDFKKYHGKCVSCSKTLDSWQDGQAAHFKPWSVCNGSFKYNVDNLALSCYFCNMNSGADIGYRFGEEMKRRHGKNHLDWIEQQNLKHRSEKLDVLFCIELAKPFIHIAD